MTELLVQQKAFVDARDDYGDTPLHAAAWRGDASVLKALVSAGANVDAPGHCGETPLAIASLRAALPAARCLLELRASVGAVDERGLTPLHSAARSSVAQAVELLLHSGAHATDDIVALLHEVARETQAQHASKPNLSALAEQHSREWGHRILHMPPLATRLLVCNESPSSVMPAALLREQVESHRVKHCTLFNLRTARTALGAAKGAVLSAHAVLSRAACAALREAVDVQGINRVDSVDGLPNRDLLCTEEALGQVIGQRALRTLLELPGRYAAAGDSGLDPRGFVLNNGRKCFARRYSADTPRQDQPLTSFHFDGATVTVNVALTSDDAIEGGRLLGVYGGAVQAISRQEGDATVHSSSLLHAVSMMRRGVRYSLIMFFDYMPAVGDADG